MLNAEIEQDIARCQEHSTIAGSERLFDELVAKYTTIFPGFSDKLQKTGKVAAIGSEFDFRNELKNLAAKLQGYRLLGQKGVSKTVTSKEKLCDLVEVIPTIEGEFEREDTYGFNCIYRKPRFVEWNASVKYELQKMPQSPIIAECIKLLESFNGWKDEENFSTLSAKLKIIIENFEDYTLCTGEAVSVKKSVFIVHGHDVAAKIETARFIESIDLTAIILHEQANCGKTIIEKLEEYTDVGFAIVLYTPCDIGGIDEKSLSKRARQNVVFEHGYLISKLGRGNVAALVKGDVETPGDVSGVVYTPMDGAGAWKYFVARELKASGFEIDMNRIS